jgi:hypothetical protein
VSLANEAPEFRVFPCENETFETVVKPRRNYRYSDAPKDASTDAPKDAPKEIEQQHFLAETDRQFPFPSLHDDDLIATTQ